MQVRAAHLAGVLQLILAVGVLVEVVRRFVFGSEPETKNYEMLSDTDFKVLPSRKSDDLRDPYMWLDVRNAEVFIDALYTQIEAIDPKNKQIFMKNRDALKYKVAALDRKFEFGFRGIAAGISWMYHDTQQYFEQSYAFKTRGFLSEKPAEDALTENLFKMRAALSDLDKICFFTEEGLTEKNLSLAVIKDQVKVEKLKSFGLSFPAGPELYVDLMQYNYDTIANCYASIGAKYSGPQASKLKTQN
jgi:ABC-type Zn2+ transport system substrate-binding protein/surface adhesin